MGWGTFLPVTRPSQGKRKTNAAAAGSSIILYHQTSPEVAKAILATGRMKPGAKGYGGGGIYFAAVPQETICKATKKGVILECEVQLGNVKEISKSGDWSSKLWQWWYNYDSIMITSLSDGVEFVVFDTSRVNNIRLWNPAANAEATVAALMVVAVQAAWLEQCVQCVLLALLQMLSSPSSFAMEPSKHSIERCSHQQQQNIKQQ